MSKNTSIEWADSTLNPMMGCDGCELWRPGICRTCNKPIIETSVGEYVHRATDLSHKIEPIEDCYAGSLTERYAGHSTGYPQAFDKPKLFLGRLIEAEKWRDLTGTDREDKPWLNGLPRCIFLNDMGDTFTESLPLDWLSTSDPILGGRTPLEVLAGMKAIIMLLTKRPSRMRKFFETRKVPDNFMLMTSVTSATTVGRVKELAAIKSPWRGISYEPAWGPIDWKMVPTGAISLIIYGGQSGPKRRPQDLAWARSTRDYCARHGHDFFMKQVDKVLPIPPDLLVRQMTRFTLREVSHARS